MERTIYIITTPEKILLRAFTSRKEALDALETEYKKIERECYLEPCALLIDSDFIQEIKEEKITISALDKIIEILNNELSTNS